MTNEIKSDRERLKRVKQTLENPPKDAQEHMQALSDGYDDKPYAAAVGVYEACIGMMLFDVCQILDEEYNNPFEQLQKEKTMKNKFNLKEVKQTKEIVRKRNSHLSIM